MNKEICVAVIFILVASVIIAVYPLVQIWAINALFRTNIEYTVLNWLAATVLNFTLRVPTSSSKK